MPYYIQNPALQGFQEGNQTARQNMGIFGGMMENYLNNAAAAARQQAQQAKELDVYRLYAAKGYTPAGQAIGSAAGSLIGNELTKMLDEIYRRSPFVNRSLVGTESPESTGIAGYNIINMMKPTP